jgi:ribosomal protection tetracycline resistance protein
VFRRALQGAGTTVCAPVSEFDVDIPARSISQVLQRLLAAGATPRPPEIRDSRCRIVGSIPTDQVHTIEQRLPDLTGGEGFLIALPSGYQPVLGPPPTRAVGSAPDQQ